MADYTNYLQETLKGLISWISLHKDISDAEKEQKIGELIEDLNHTGADMGVMCMGSLNGLRSCTTTMKIFSVEGNSEGSWICPACGNSRPAIRINGIWFEK